MFHYGLADELLKVSSMWANAGRKSPHTRRILFALAKRRPRGTGATMIRRGGYTAGELSHHQRIKSQLSNITKTSSIRETLRRLGETIKENPKDLARIAKEMASGEGGQVAKGMVYGAGGYGALKGIPRKNPETKKREPFEGAGRGALKGMAIGLPLAALFRYPALKKALGVS